MKLRFFPFTSRKPDSLPVALIAKLQEFDNFVKTYDNKNTTKVILGQQIWIFYRMGEEKKARQLINFIHPSFLSDDYYHMKLRVVDFDITELILLFLGSVDLSPQFILYFKFLAYFKL